ncbi:hypothetical protein [Streptomyces chattanoogensis]|uniref:hypothetical protein n=1 Tax=Streptomyces chattanoogensis TaxID=66876 RepID=UPI0036A57237
MSTVTVTWYDAVSGGNSLGTSAGNLTVTNQSGWFNANYVVVIGTAPTGALSAAITWSVSGLGAGEYVNTDDVNAVVANLFDSNLLDYNTSSVEKDASGWIATNATASRGSWVLETGAGYFGLNLLSSASGSVDAVTVANTAVTPGTVYRLYALIYSVDLAGYTCYGEIRWYDASNNLLSTTQNTFTGFHQAVAERVTVVGTAPAGASYCKVAIRPQCTAGSQTFSVESVWLRVAPNAAGNLLTYDEFSTESLLPAWTTEGPASALYRAALTSGLTDGYYALRADPTGTGIIKGSLNRLIPVTPGTTYKISSVMWRFNSNTANTVTSSYRTLIDWYDAAGNIYQADNPDQFYSYDSSSQWLAHTNTETRTAPAGAAYARVIFEISHAANGGSYYYVDNMAFIVSTPEYTLSKDDVKGVITYTLNTQPPYGTQGTVSIYRVHQDGTTVPLRGYGVEYNKAPFTSSPLVVEDYEAPLGERVWYKTDWYDTGGIRSLREYTQSIATPVIADPDYVWFKSPGLPATNVLVMVEAPPKWSRAARSSRYEVVGRKNPVHITGVRGGIEASVSFLVWDEVSNGLLNALLDSGLPALMQAMPGYGVSGNRYLSIGDIEVEPLSPDAREDGWRWTLQLAEIDRPSGGLQGSASLTWQSITDTYATWEDLFDADATWAEVLTEG